MKTTRQQVHQQAGKMIFPPYGLTLHRRPQLQLLTEPRRPPGGHPIMTAAGLRDAFFVSVTFDI